LKDDILVISASKKFVGQIIAAAILINFAGVQITNMHGFLGIYEIPKFGSIFLSLFTIIVITNSFNLIDGVDGLAGSLGFLTTLYLESIFIISANALRCNGFCNVWKSSELFNLQLFSR
jgi:UDP-N-acetylmuramyl pentapeptide phosphotransferase/UDP-N-acetylglucosamine-1-phosphate transferase